MPGDRALTPTSYIVLGLLAEGPGTSYDLKQCQGPTPTPGTTHKAT